MTHSGHWLCTAAMVLTLRADHSCARIVFQETQNQLLQDEAPLSPNINMVMGNL
jgi:hypothetical protein